MATIYHNPRCSKSRQTLELIKHQGIEPEIVLYLETPLDAQIIAVLLKKLGIKKPLTGESQRLRFKEN